MKDHKKIKIKLHNKLDEYIIIEGYTHEDIQYQIIQEIAIRGWKTKNTWTEITH